MNRKIAAIALMVTLLSMALFTSVVNASIYNGTADFTCSTVTLLNTGSHILNRDNTGLGREAVRIEVTDGAGTVILSHDYMNILGTYGAGSGVFAYTSVPAYNPLTVRIISLAGNGLSEQVDFTAQGVCSGLTVFGSGYCANPLPTNFAVRSVPDGALAYYQPSSDAYTGFNLPVGQSWYTGTAEDGWVEVWIACDGTNVFVPAENVIGSGHEAGARPQQTAVAPVIVISEPVESSSEGSSVLVDDGEDGEDGDGENGGGENGDGENGDT